MCADPCHLNLTEILPPPSLSSFAVGNFGCMQAATGDGHILSSPRVNINLAAGLQITFIWAGAVPLPDQPSGKVGLAPYKQL